MVILVWFKKLPQFFLSGQVVYILSTDCDFIHTYKQ